MARRTPEQLAADEPRGTRTFWALDKRARDPSVSLEARALWRIIDTFANRFGEGAFPSIDKLCQLCNRDRKAIFRYIKELETAKWMVHTHAKGKSNNYLVIYPVGAPKKARNPSPKRALLPVPNLGTLSHSTVPKQPINGHQRRNDRTSASYRMEPAQ